MKSQFRHHFKTTLYLTSFFLLLSVLFSLVPVEALCLSLISREDKINEALHVSMQQASLSFSDMADMETDSAKKKIYAENATLFQNYTYRADKLARVDAYYEKYYIMTEHFHNMWEVTDTMVALLCEHYYLDKLTDEDKVTDALINCYLAVVKDRYATYFSAEDNDVYHSQLSGEYVGIGISVVKRTDNYIQVVSTFLGSPAEKAGILPGDVLVAVDGEDIVTLGYYQTVAKVRGEIFTDVTLSIERNEVVFDVTIKRDKVTEQSVFWEMQEIDGKKIGNIQITQFDEHTYVKFVDAVETLEKNGAQGFVFDVRDNPGGLLQAVLAVTEYILPQGDLVFIDRKDSTVAFSSVLAYVGATEKNKAYYHKAINHQIDLPMVVLCNENTISAGELFTASLKDYGVADIFGKTTYGKGTGQTGKNLMLDASVLNMSTFYYRSPVSPNYEGIGVVPLQKS